ncbi:MAG: hypothetical protein OER87_07510 [Gammaproteobacteria bacterium]|nr:hypothetical protein [Gammaproteobacteria bacterium]MDH3535575.1 hypothetical protein [Gammaproteobacteria bacterium]
MNVDLILAMIKRREQRAKDRANELARDPSLRASAQQQRAVFNAMATLRGQIEDAIATEGRD